MEGGAIALRFEKEFDGPTGFAARLVQSKIDFAEAREGVNHCLANHVRVCELKRDDKLRTAKMVEVVTRKVIDCPENCDYFALSYVWGDVMPAEGALEKRTLPQTIEDAMTATREMGWRYLWVSGRIATLYEWVLDDLC